MNEYKHGFQKDKKNKNKKIVRCIVTVKRYSHIRTVFNTIHQTIFYKMATPMIIMFDPAFTAHLFFRMFDSAIIFDLWRLFIAAIYCGYLLRLFVEAIH